MVTPPSGSIVIASCNGLEDEHGPGSLVDRRGASGIHGGVLMVQVWLRRFFLPRHETLLVRLVFFSPHRPRALGRWTGSRDRRPSLLRRSDVKQLQSWSGQQGPEVIPTHQRAMWMVTTSGSRCSILMQQNKHLKWHKVPQVVFAVLLPSHLPIHPGDK